MDEIITKLLQTTNDPNDYEAALIITGAGGFGKTNTVISLCHEDLIKEHFTDGFVFIELGPQATDPTIKLKGICNSLFNEQCDINVVEQKINQLTNDYYRNLLVIIDDVWDVKDAEPLVKAFSNCTTILTTSMNNIQQYISSKQSVIVGPMTQDEAICLLTSKIIKSSQLSHEDRRLLEELAQDVHLWPLLLSLIRGQFSHYLRQYHLSYNQAIHKVQTMLHHKGLTAFDKNNINIEAIDKSRRLAVKACIETTLELLTQDLSNKMKVLILWTGIGTSLQTAVLKYLWSITEHEAESIINELWGYGLVYFSNIASPVNITQHCVEVHAVISQYSIESIDSYEVNNFLPHCTKTVSLQIRGTFQQSYGINNPLSLTPIDFLKYKLSEIENSGLPFYLKLINMQAVLDPHMVILRLQQIKSALTSSPYTINLFSLLDKDINSLITECKEILRNVHKISRKLNQSVQRNLYEKDYVTLIQTVEEFINNYSLFNVAQKAVIMAEDSMPYCDDKTRHRITIECEYLQIMKSDYHTLTTLTLPYIKLYIKLHNQITSSLLHGSPDIQNVYDHIMYGKFSEELELVKTNRFIKLEEVAPNIVPTLAS